MLVTRFAGKTWYYRMLQHLMRSVVIVLVPLVPLLEEALQGAKHAGIKAMHIKELPADRHELKVILQEGCIVFCSYEAASSIRADAVCKAAIEIGGLLVFDEAHMAYLDMRCAQL